jgi:hypothetical protein
VLTLLSVTGGFLFGYDTGVVSGAMVLIRSAATDGIIICGAGQTKRMLILGITGESSP